MDRPFPGLSDSGPRRLAAAGALLFVATFVASVVLSGPPIVHERQQGIEHSLSERGLVPVFTSMFMLVLGLLALTVTLAFLANALGRSSAGSALAAQTAWSGGLGYLFIIAVAFSAGAAAAWAKHGGSELEIVLVINNVRNFAYFAAMPFMGVTALGFGAAAIADNVMTRWVGWGASRSVSSACWPCRRPRWESATRCPSGCCGGLARESRSCASPLSMSTPNPGCRR